MSKHIYLASPYTADDACVRELRCMQACHAAARLMRDGFCVFSPIAHSHSLTAFEVPGDFSFWQEWCFSFLESWATDLYVLPLEGWQNSVGVNQELRMAERLGLPVSLYDIEDERLCPGC